MPIQAMTPWKFLHAGVEMMPLHCTGSISLIYAVALERTCKIRLGGLGKALHTNVQGMVK
jgi:hypothetical protein